MAVEMKTTLDHIHSSGEQAQVQPIRSFALKMGRFILSFLEMTLSMMVGMPLLFMLRNLVPASSPFAAAYRSGTILFDIAMTVFMAIPMLAWMIVRRHGWRHSIEMAAGMAAPVAVIVVLRLLGAEAYLPWLSKAGHLAMFLGMLAAMLYRVDHYTAGHASHQQHVHATQVI